MGIVRIDRPPVNAIDARLVAGLVSCCEELDAAADLRAAVVYGGEKTFSAGADLKEMADGDGLDVQERVRALQRAIGRLEAVRVVTIAAITGYALGGGLEIAMGCDFRFAASRARVGQPEIVVGLMPGAGGTQRLPRLVGIARAKRMVYTGEFVDASTALQWGLVDEVADGEDVLDRALETAARYAAGPTRSLAAAKHAINAALDTDLSTGLELELQAFSSLFQTDDARHGLESFAKEGPGKARFTGR